MFSHPYNFLQWNLDVTQGQGTGKICSLYQGFFISRFFFIYFTIAMTRVKKIVHYTEDFAIERFVISRFHRISVFKLLKPQELIYTENDH